MIERKEVVEEEVVLGQYLGIIRQRRWTIIYTAVAVLVVGCIATALMTPVYQAQGKLLVRATAPQVSAVNTENPLVDLLAMAQPESVDTQVQVLQSQPFLDEVFTLAHAPRGPRQPRVRVAGVRDTNVIDVTVEYPDPQMAARVANTALEHYLDRTAILSLQEITRARQFIQKDAQKARRELQQAEDRLLSFGRANRVEALTAEQQNRAQTLLDLESKSREAHSDIQRVQAQIRAVQAQLASQPRERLVTTGQPNPGVAALRTHLAEATVERAALLKSYRPAHLKVRTVDATITSLQAQLASEPAELRVPLHVPNERYEKLVDRLDGYQSDLDGLQAQAARLDPQLEQERQRIEQLGPWELRLAQLQRDRDMAEKSYLGLAGKLEDLQIRENARRSTARIIEQALPPESPIRPRRATNIAVSLVLGILLGGCLAFVLDCLDDRMTSSDEVERLLGLPLLAQIPSIAGKGRLIRSLPPYSPVAESYRGLRSSISFSAVDAPLCALGVTSSRPGEGKSTTAVNLALAMALDGRQVILVDTDLRRPSLHQMLGLSASPGLTDVLTGHCSLDEALQADPDCHLLILTSGPIPPNPAEMLNTAAMESVIRELKARADIVIFDTPPCLPVTDAQVLGTRLDGMVLVGELGEARKADLRHTSDLLEQAHIRILGMVLNKVGVSTSGYYRSGYYRPEYAARSDRNHSQNGHHDDWLLPRAIMPRGSGPDRREMTD